jgi:hypothetical protein
MDDLVTVGKMLAVVLTGAFGILGLVTEFRNPTTKRLTRWGSVSLIGIVVSTTVGVLTQVGETAHQNKDRQDQQDKYQADLERNIHISENTNTAVEALRRVLAPLDNLTVSVTLKASCNMRDLKRLCEHARRIPPGIDQFLDNGSHVISSIHPLLLGDWPPRGKDTRVPMRMGIYCSDKLGQEPKRGVLDSDLGFELFGDISGDTAYAEIEVDDNRDVLLSFSGLRPVSLRSTERITSTQDFSGCTLVFSADTQFPMEPIKIAFEVNHGRTIELDPHRFTKKNQWSTVEYRFDKQGH